MQNPGARLTCSSSSATQPLPSILPIQGKTTILLPQAKAARCHEGVLRSQILGADSPLCYLISDHRPHHQQASVRASIFPTRWSARRLVPQHALLLRSFCFLHSMCACAAALPCEIGMRVSVLCEQRGCEQLAFFRSFCDPCLHVSACM